MTNMGQINAAKALEENKRLQKLKNLSNKYTSNRKDFLEAIDRYQENQLILNSPKGGAQGGYFSQPQKNV